MSTFTVGDEYFGIKIGEMYRLKIGLPPLLLDGQPNTKLMARSVDKNGTVCLGLEHVVDTAEWHYTHLIHVPHTHLNLPTYEKEMSTFKVGDVVRLKDKTRFPDGQSTLTISYENSEYPNLQQCHLTDGLSSEHLMYLSKSLEHAHTEKDVKVLKKVILESPFAGDIPANEEYARKCLSDSIHKGEAPLASHLLYTQPNVLDDTIPEERALGISAGHVWIGDADLMVVYTDQGVSKGMAEGIKKAYDAGLPVEFRELPMEEPLEVEEVVNYEALFNAANELLEVTQGLSVPSHHWSNWYARFQTLNDTVRSYQRFF
jgi:hypothetical protein